MQQPKGTPFDKPEALEGNLYPRDGATYDSDQYFDQPEERVEEEREESADQAAALPFLKQIHGWFDEQIAMCDSIDNIQLNDLKMPMGDQEILVPRPVSVEAQVYAFQLLKQRLIEKKSSFPELEVESE